MKRVTLNEVLRLARRVLVSLGAGPGCERDPALAVAWLESRGLGGLRTLDEDLPALRRHGAAAPRILALDEAGAGRLELDAEGASALWPAAAVVDWLLSRPGGARAHLDGVRSPHWLLPFLAVPTGRALWLEARDGSGARLFAADTNGRGAVGVRGWPGLDGLVGVTAHVEAGCGAAPGFAGDAPALDDAVLARWRRDAVRHGVHVDAALWARLSRVALECLVPESEFSRARGAGGGDDNA